MNLNNLHLSRLNILGIFLLIIAVLIISTNFLDQIVLILTHPFLEGSSKGKAILFFGLMGTLLVFYPLFKADGKIMLTLKNLNPLFNLSSKNYLKISILTIAVAYMLGLILEISIRAQYNVSIFTTFVSLKPSLTTSGIIHSHIYKSIIGALTTQLGLYVPSSIHTGTSLINYVAPSAYIVLILFPLAFLTGIISLNERRDINALILTFSLTTALIGIMDGGLFSIPALIGLAGLLGIYYVKKHPSLSNLLKPSLLIILIILIRFSLLIVGTNTDYYELTFIGPINNTEIHGYDVIDMKTEKNKIIIRLKSDENEKQILSGMNTLLKPRCDAYFISWNFWAWFY
ncbi:MAG: hypothetical protein QME14_02325 [Methanobacteriaceae archaeon]|nr:hypothetical protein [Methanobacteriaceae archaeon]